MLKNIENFDPKSRITKADATEELKVSKAPSRNRVVYPCQTASSRQGFRVPFLGTFFACPDRVSGGKQKGTKQNF